MEKRTNSKVHFSLLIIVAVLVIFVQCTTKVKEDKPPTIQAQPVTETYFGVEITDHYRNLENLEDTNVVNWMKGQADYARNIINSIPGRQDLIDKMVEFDARVSSKVNRLQITENDLYFYLKTTPEDETGKLYYRKGFEGKETFLFDPMEYDKNSNKKYTISAISPSDLGEKIVIQIAPDGSESSDLLVFDVNEKSFYPEKIDRIWFGSPSWLPDASAFLYNRLNSSDVHEMGRELNSKVFLHKVGESPEKDMEFFSNANNPELNIKPQEIPIVMYDKDCGYIFGLVLTVDNRITCYYAPIAELPNKKINWKPLIKQEDEVYNFSATDKELYVFTPKEAPNFQILKTSIANPDLALAEIVIPEDKKKVLTGFTITNDALYYTMAQNGVREIVFRKSMKDNKVEELKLPFAAGTAYIGSKGFKFDDLWVTIAGWTSNSKRYRYVSGTKEFELENLSDLAEYPEYENLVAEEVMVPSHDGVMVPLSLIYNKELQKDGNAPVFLWGYGAYGASMNPGFSPNQLLFTQAGGIVAVAHVRGGGELGDSWHKAGFKTTKPNTWKDLIACAEYLIAESYSSSDKIAIWSGSAGGILIGRAITERPDLFAAAILEVGCMNTLRGENSPNGPVNIPEFGTSQDSLECMALIEMDSYHHLKEGEKYPATLITAGMNDPRVIVWQPAKFAAKMQELNDSDHPILFFTDFGAGHGIGNTKTKQFENLADALSFSLWQTNHPNFQLK